MMHRAGWVGMSRTLTALVLLGLLTWVSIEGYSTLRASSLVQSLGIASTTEVPGLVQQLDGHRRWANPRLKTMAQSADDTSQEKLHASLALLPVDASQLPFLEKRLLVASPTELPVIRSALEPHRATLVPKLWSVLDKAKAGDESLLTAASALALYDPLNPRWDEVGGKLTQALVSVNSLLLRPWIDALRPVRGKLTVPLATIFRDKSRSEREHTLATDILTDYAGDDPDHRSTGGPPPGVP